MRAAPAPAPAAIAVKDHPSADLVVCARRGPRLPEDQVAVLPPALRAALILFATTFAANADQLDRLVNWVDPAAACAPSEKK